MIMIENLRFILAPQPSKDGRGKLEFRAISNRLPRNSMDTITALILTSVLSLILTARCSDPRVITQLLKPTASEGSLCTLMIQPLGYPCSEHTVETKDGFLLSVQRVRGKNNNHSIGKPVFLQHGLFQGGDTWFVNSPEESLGFILADQGYDVWVGNVRGTRWSHGHVSLSVHNRDFWDWSWQELAENDLTAMISYVYLNRDSKLIYIGHSQGTIMALAAFTTPNTVKMIEAAALLCPISYLDHLSSRFVRQAVSMHLDQMLLTMGIHQLNFRSAIGVQVLDYVCDGHMDCNNMLAAITGDNCCFNKSRVEYYLEYEPHPSSTKNLNHLFQMIRKGTFAKYDYGLLGNMRLYGQFNPPSFNLQDIPSSLPLWMAHGGRDALADTTDVKRTVNELRSKPQFLYLESYGHIDFIMSIKAKDDVYDSLIMFLQSIGGGSGTY